MTRQKRSFVLQKKIISFPFPNDFGDQLAQQLDEADLTGASDHGGKVHKIQKALFQADTVIAHAMKNCNCTFALANYTDYGFLAGHQSL